jgi:hypothetical protein
MASKMPGVVQRALKFVNRVREAEGRKPLKQMPKGIPSDTFHCPLASALDGGLVGVEGDCLEVPLEVAQCFYDGGAKLRGDGNDVYIGKQNLLYVRLNAPKAVQDFVEWFDAQDHEEAQKLAEV